MKAISEIIVVILILLVAVSLVGIFYTFIMDMNSQTSSDIGQSNEQALKKIGSCLQIVSFDDKTGNLWVKNCGTQAIGNITVFMDGASLFSKTVGINPKEIKNITVFMPSGSHILKLTGGFVPVATSVTIP